MDLEVLDLLDDLRYEPTYDENSLPACLDDCLQYSKLVGWVCAELKVADNKIDEVVNSMSSLEDLSSFKIELSSILNELDCPYSIVLKGKENVNSRFDTREERLVALNFLLHELLARRILAVHNQKQLSIQLDESKEARLLREILQALGLPKPPANVTINGMCSKIQEKVSQGLAKWKNGGLDNTPLFTGVLTAKQWGQLTDLDQQFQNEYKVRREMLLKRLDVTIQSFHWSDRLQSKKDQMTLIFRELRQHLDPNPAVTLSDVLAARTDLAYIEKTSSASVRQKTKSAVNSILIGKVPDRGGRPSETRAPPPEMPAWTQRQGGGPQGSVGWSQPQRPRGDGRGGRGSGGHRGGRGGHDQQQHHQQAGNQGWEHAGGRADYQQNQGWEQRGDRGGYQDGRGRGGHHGNWDGQQEQYQRGGGRGYGSRGSRVQGGWSNY